MPVEMLLRIEATPANIKLARKIYAQHRQDLDTLTPEGRLEFLQDIQEFNPGLMAGFRVIWNIQ